MFNCAKCEKAIGPGEAPVQFVTSTREVTYPEREYKRKGENVYDRGGHGFETVTSEMRCSECSKEGS